MAKITLVLLMLAIMAVLTLAQGPSLDQVEQVEAHKKVALKSLEYLNHGADPISAAKIKKLNAPHIEYYHEIQKTNDREVDLTARAVIDTPERVQWRAQQKANAKFVKTVLSAGSLLRAHDRLMGKGGKIRKF